MAVAGANILVVEDQRAVAGALRMRLRGLGYDVLGIAKDGTEAIEKAQELKPDLILMDIRLGEGMDGIEAAHKIRSQLDIPVVYVSAYADRDDLLDRARATDPAGFINKPFTTKDLLTTLNLALDRQRGHRQTPAAVATPLDAVITTDVNGRVTFINRGAETLTGWNRDSVVGQRLARILVTLYGLGEEAAENMIRHALAHGREQALPRRADGGGAAQDALTPLRDTRGGYFGVALRFSGDTVKHGMVALERFARGSRFLLDQLPLAILMVDRQLNIEYRNRRAATLLERYPLLCSDGAVLGAPDATQRAQLQGLVRRAAERSADATRATSEMLTLTSSEREHSVLMVAIPMPSEAGTPCVALLLYEEPGYFDLSAPVLREMYGLTRAEINLVQSLAHGHSLEQGALGLGISVNTARTHLKHIFHKTGAKRQSELIHQVESGPATWPLRLDED